MLSRRLSSLLLFFIASTALLQAQAPGSVNGMQTELLGKEIFVPQDNILKVVASKEETDTEDKVSSVVRGLTNQKRPLAVKITLPKADITDGSLTLGISSEEAGELRIDIYDEEGFAFQTDKKLKLKRGENYFILDVSFLESGKYYIELMNLEGESSLFSVNVRKSIVAVDEIVAISLNFMGQKIEFNPSDILKVKRNGIEVQDNELLTTVMRSFFQEDPAAVLPIEFMAVDEPVINGFFVFSITSDAPMQLNLSVVDESGYVLITDNAIDFKAGTNYKALEFMTIENGTYFLTLNDENQKRWSYQIVVYHNN